MKFKNKIFIGLGILIAILIVFTACLVKYSTSPYFCKSCHIMKPYYNAWKTSKHNKVSCVECHYPPTDQTKDVLWKKFQALSQVVKYVTRTYSSKPYAEVKDESCLQSSCHSTRLLKSKVIFKNNIIFDHKPHVEQVRRGRHLKCTSCHSQIVVGKHVEVTVDTCYLCHFKGTKDGRNLSPIGSCLSCHKIPDKPFVIKNITYRHYDFVVKHKVSCEKCHIDVITGDGEAPKERCFTCHNQPEKIERYKDIQFMHDNHVTKHNVACFHCHREIRHGFRVAVKEKEVLFECNLCHIDKHTAQKEIYVGKGGIGVYEMPSPMFLSNVDCVGCHINLKEDVTHEEFTGKTFYASEESCVKCHGKKYKGIVNDSKNAINETLLLIKEKLNNAREELKRLRDKDKIKSAESLLDRVEHNIKFIEVAHGVHNIYYTSQLLAKSDSYLDEISKLLNISLKNIKDNKVISGGFCATLCHQKIGVKVPGEIVKFKGKTMPHKKHYEEANILCISCHEFREHKRVKLKENLPCKECHSEERYND